MKSYYDLSPVAKYLIVAVVVLFIIAALSSCSSLHGGTKGKAPKYVELSCPVYPNYKHYVRQEKLKRYHPDTCPAYN